MNIVHVIPALDRAHGGPVVALLGLVKAQSKLGDKVHIIASTYDGADSFQEQLASPAVRITTPDSANVIARNLQFFAAFARALRSADVVHIHGLWQLPQTVAALQARARGVPYIIRPCGMLDTWSLSQNRLAKSLHLRLITRRILNGASLLHATTESEKQEILKCKLGPPISVIPNGVDDDGFTAHSDVLPGELRSLKESHQILLFLARVHPKKGLDVLIPAVAQMRTKSAVLLIVGPKEPSYHVELIRELRQRGIEDRVHIVDPVYGEARFATYSAADLYLLPSKQENFGISVAEAMARGVPVIISPEVALSDLVARSRAGLVVPRDPDLLANAIDDLLNDDERRIDMGNNGRQVALQQFQWSMIAARLREVYRSTLAPRTLGS